MTELRKGRVERMTREKLQKVYHLNEEIKMWKRELEKLQWKSLTAAPDTSEPQAAGGPGDRVGNYAAQKTDIEKTIELHLKEIEEARIEIIEFIRDIPDSLMRQIVYYRCCSLMQWREIADCINQEQPGYTEETIRQKYSRFLREMTEGEKLSHMSHA